MIVTPEEIPCPVSLPEFPTSHGENSIFAITLVEGAGISLWSDAERDQAPEEAVKVQLEPNQVAVIGRQEGGEVPYLDPSYRSTQMMPNSTHSVLLNSPRIDNCVSRGHFTLKACAGGIVLVNGVPRRGGGIRPPVNGTLLLGPEYRWLGAGEEYVIERGSSIRIRLPNGTVLAIGSE